MPNCPHRHCEMRHAGRGRMPAVQLDIPIFGVPSRRAGRAIGGGHHRPVFDGVERRMRVHARHWPPVADRRNAPWCHPQRLEGVAVAAARVQLLRGRIVDAYRGSRQLAAGSSTGVGLARDDGEERLWISPSCGFGRHPARTRPVLRAKLEHMMEAASSF